MGKFLFGDTSKESIIEIPQGQLYLVRPLSPKGHSELIFKDAAASIRRTAQEFHYQLIVQRAYEEGEEELLADEEDEDGVDGALVTEKDEKSFLLDEGLHFRVESRNEGESVFAWKDLSGDLGDHYEFVCDRSISPATLGTFELVAIQCQYERKYRQSHQRATEEELQQFSFSGSPLLRAEEKSSPAPMVSSPAAAAKARHSAEPSHQHADVAKSSPREPKDAPREETRTEAPPSAHPPKQLEVFVKERAELHLFDFRSAEFILQDPEVTALVSQTGPWQYWLQITGKEKDWLAQEVVPEINPVFNFEYLSFIFNHSTADGSTYSWLLRFSDEGVIERFQEGLMRALWERLNKISWSKTKDTDREYVLEAFQDLTMEDATEGAEFEEGEDVEEHKDDEEDADDGRRSEHYDSDESDDDVTTRDDDGNVNSQLAVGYKHDRSFVVRGSKIGVFKHTPNNKLEFSTNISKVETPKGKLFSPKKVMLHAEDSNMILQNEHDPHSLYRMDLESGKVVDEWKVHDDIPVTMFAPEKVRGHSSS